MNLIVEIPDDIAGRLIASDRDLSRRALEALLADEYKYDQITNPNCKSSLARKLIRRRICGERAVFSYELD
jgi:hypothetical protein